jgi:hypothetical protein
VDGAVGLCGLQDGEHGGGATEVEQSAAAGGDVLVVAGAGAKRGAELIVSPTEPLRGPEGLDAPHASDPAPHAAVVLLEPVVLVGAGPVPHAPGPVSSGSRADRCASRSAAISYGKEPGFRLILA